MVQWLEPGLMGPAYVQRGARSVVSPSKIGKPLASPHCENRENFLSLIPLMGVAVFQQKAKKLSLKSWILFGEIKPLEFDGPRFHLLLCGVEYIYKMRTVSEFGP